MSDCSGTVRGFLGRRRQLLGLGAAAMAAPGIALAQSQRGGLSRVIVPFAAGGTGDIVARAISPALSQRWGREIVVENMPGAGGAIGWRHVAMAGKDGLTVLATDTSYAMAAAVIPHLGFNPRTAFTHVGTTATTPFVVVVSSAVAAKTLSEFITYARSHPGKLNYGSGGNGSSSHLGGEWFKHLTGTFMTHIAYRGGAGAIQDLIGGRIDVAFLAVPSVAQHVRSGRLRALAVSAVHRVSALPDVPSAKEAGLAQFVGVNWFGLSVPTGTAAEVVDGMSRDLNAVLSMPETKARFASLGLDAAPSTPAQAAAFVKEEIDRWTTVVKVANIQPE